MEAGHTVGRITSAHDYDSRLSVTVCGSVPSIEDYNNAVEALKHAVRREPEAGYLREEVTFTLSLLLCRLLGCQYIILQGLSRRGYALDAVCAPYELILLPTVYDKDGGVEWATSACESIRRGVREVVSGNQRSEIYHVISNACAMSGVRLDIPVKSQFEVTAVTARSLTFNYGERQGFTMRSPSRLLCDSAMAVIEAALALRRGGVKFPWSSIQEGIAKATGTGCFELLSLSPLVVIDSASDVYTAALTVETLKDIFGENMQGELSVCIPKAASEALAAFEEIQLESVIIYDETPKAEGEAAENEYDTVKKCAKAVSALMKNGKNVICLGSAGFAEELKGEFLRIV